jgi:hypothetical protein
MCRRNIARFGDAVTLRRVTTTGSPNSQLKILEGHADTTVTMTQGRTTSRQLGSGEKEELVMFTAMLDELVTLPTAKDRIIDKDSKERQIYDVDARASGKVIDLHTSRKYKV